MMEGIAIAIISTLVSVLLTWYGKGQYDKRTNAAKTDLNEIDTHSELYTKMQSEFVKLHNEIFEYQKDVSELKASNIKLQEQVKELIKEVKEANERADLYRQALERKSNEE